MALSESPPRPNDFPPFALTAAVDRDGRPNGLLLCPFRLPALTFFPFHVILIPKPNFMSIHGHYIFKISATPPSVSGIFLKAGCPVSTPLKRIPQNKGLKRIGDTGHGYIRLKARYGRIMSNRTTPRSALHPPTGAVWLVLKGRWRNAKNYKEVYGGTP